MVYDKDTNNIRLEINKVEEDIKELEIHLQLNYIEQMIKKENHN